MARRVQDEEEKRATRYVRCRNCNARVEVKRRLEELDCPNCMEMATDVGFRAKGPTLKGELGREAMKLLHMVMSKKLTPDEAIELYDEMRRKESLERDGLLNWDGV